MLVVAAVAVLGGQDDPQPEGLEWTRSEDTTRASKCATRTKGPTIAVDLDDDDDQNDEDGEASSSETDDAETSIFKLRKHAPGEGTSAAGAAG